MASETDKRIQDTSSESSIFDGGTFKYLKIPREVFMIEDLTAAERMILSRVIYWTRKGRPCRETNRQFGELIDQSARTARRAIGKLIELGHIEAHYLNIKATQQRDGYRDLTAMVGVDGEMILKRKAAQLGQNMGRSNSITSNNRAKEPVKENIQGGGHTRPGGVASDGQGGGHPRPCTTITNKETKASHKKRSGPHKGKQHKQQDEAQRQRRILFDSEKHRIKAIGGG